MVQVAGVSRALESLKASLGRTFFLGVGTFLLLLLFYASCTTRVLPNEFGVEQRKFGLKTGIVPTTYGPGLYFVGPGMTMHTFPREIHVLEASYDRQEAMSKGQAMGSGVLGKVEHDHP